MQSSLARGAVALAHDIWRQILQPGDKAIDATCGNGQDTLFIAQNVVTDSTGFLLACDIQQQAIEKSQYLLSLSLNPLQQNRIQWRCGCHSIWSEELPKREFRLIVYNLGYLPGGDKQLTTDRATTLKSIANAMPLVMKGGMISITCYPGHEEGLHEEEMLLEFTRELDSRLWSCVHHRWMNRQKAPSLITLMCL